MSFGPDAIVEIDIRNMEHRTRAGDALKLARYVAWGCKLRNREVPAWVADIAQGGRLRVSGVDLPESMAVKRLMSVVEELDNECPF